MPWLGSWNVDPAIVASAALALVAYALGVRRSDATFARRWPRVRTVWFVVGVISAIVAIESPLDAAGRVRFAPHMIAHLILTDLTAPAILAGAPLLLALRASSTAFARRIVRALESRLGRIASSPLVTWTVFVVALWLVHETTFFEIALEREPVHIIEHAIFLGTALLFWFPIVTIGPTPLSGGGLAFPLRVLYVLAAMPAEGVLGFTIATARHVRYPAYAAAGLADQAAAGEIMWVGGTLAMLVALLFVGAEWARREREIGERFNARMDAAERLAGRSVR